jgi:uncharacterized phage infection (PIP) family protein YhgE
LVFPPPALRVILYSIILDIIKMLPTNVKRNILKLGTLLLEKSETMSAKQIKISNNDKIHRQGNTYKFNQILDKIGKQISQTEELGEDISGKIEQLGDQIGKLQSQIGKDISGLKLQIEQLGGQIGKQPQIQELINNSNYSLKMMQELLNKIPPPGKNFQKMASTDTMQQ